MESASAKPAAAAKPQSLSLPSPMGQPDGGSPPMNMTVAEVQAVVAALPAKKDALRGAFDRLAACSPFPLPFTWDDLDAHVSSLHSSISLRLRQLRVLEVARPASTISAPATTSDSEKGKNQGEEEEKDEDGEEEMEVEEEEVEEEEMEVEEEEVEVEEEEQETEEEVEVVEVEEEVVEELEVDANDMVDEEPKADGETQEGEEEQAQLVADGKEQKADGETQEGEEEQVELVADGKEQKADMEEEAIEEQEDDDDEMRDDDEKQQETKKVCREQWIQEAKGETNKMSPKQGDSAFHCANKDLLTACTRMDYVRLLNIVCADIGGQQEYTMAMRYAPDGAALVLRVVRGFLSNKQPKTTRVWENCAWLIRCVPVVTPKLSVHMMEQAKQLAMDWKKMIDKPGSCEDLGILASWALLYFLISYKIVSEFDVDEIIRLFGSVPRKHQRKNCIQLCKDLGLVSRITDLIDYLIRNGQQLGVVHMTRILNLEDKYPLVSLLEGYVEKAKGIALELFGKSASDKSWNLAISREVEDLWLAHTMVKQQLTDSSQQSVILAEIKNLLAEYKKNRSLTNASAALTSNSRQQQKTQQKQQQQKHHGKQQAQKQKNKKRKKDQQQHEAQESQLQGKQRKIQGKQGQQQSKPQEKLQQQQQQHKLQQNKGQHQHQPQESKGQQQHEPQDEQQKKQEQNEAQQRQQQHLNRRRPCKTQLPTPLVPAPGLLPLVVPNVAQIGPFGLPPYAVMPEAHSYPAQPGLLGIQGGPFAANIGAPQYMGPFNPPQQNHLYRDPLFYPR